MLQTTKEYIKNDSDTNFGMFYQQFVVESQNRIIDSTIKRVESELSQKLASTKDLIAGMNSLSEELMKQ